MGRILVVHASLEAQEMLSLELRRAGHEPVIAVNGRHALEQYHARKPDLVIVDMLLPDMDGLSCVRSLRALDPYAEAILLTERARPEELQEARRLGVAGVLQSLFASVSTH